MTNKEIILGLGQVPRLPSTRTKVITSGDMNVQNVCMPMHEFLEYEKRMNSRARRNMFISGGIGALLGVLSYIWIGRKLY